MADIIGIAFLCVLAVVIYGIVKDIRKLEKERKNKSCGT